MSLIDRLGHALGDRYRVERELGIGGMARVYLAEDLKHHRQVAVKVLKPELSEEVDSERFLAEIRTVAGLQHPHILPLFDSGEADGLLYYVMPYVPGESLRSRLERGGALSLDEAVRIAASLGDALDHAHRQGVIHRDVKPANVMLSDGEPLLGDFGIALALEREGVARVTRTGTSVGTPGYMSPEQAAGERELGPKSDIYSLGALAYEMLTGQAPFADLSPKAALARVLTEDPPVPSDVDRTIPEAVSAEVARALSRAPEDRHDSAADFSRAIRRAALSTLAPSGLPRKGVWTAVGLAAVLLLTVGGLWYGRSRDVRWVRLEAIPEMQRLLGEGEAAAAYSLARRAAEILPDDPVVDDLYRSSHVMGTFATDPPGATVSFRPYDPDDSTWTELGTTPLEAGIPYEELLIRFELEGYEPYRAAITPIRASLEVELRPAGEPMVRQAPGAVSSSGEAVSVDGFWMDEYEVTNAAYRDFVEAAQSWDSTLWVEPFRRRGLDVDLERFRTQFVDATGRPGPPGWELSRPPTGQEEMPVQGVSWFEAVAYCAYRDAELPTYHHWKVADGGETSPWDGVIQHANLGTGQGTGPWPVGTSESYGPGGLADMAGNVREWVWNAADDERYVLGGSWDSPPYLYLEYDAADPWSRSPENGIRCARYGPTLDESLRAPIDQPIFDFRTLEPVDDATFAGFATFYEYDRAPLNVVRDAVEETDAWIREYVEVDAAYLDERVPVHLFLPQDVEPPYQTVVYFPGSAGTTIASSENLSEMAALMFIPRSGRALAYPVLKGMYERRATRPPRGEVELRQRYVWIVQDVMRTVDFVEEAPDLDVDALAYLGLSLGAELAVPVALEKRFDALVLVGGALDPAWRGGVPEESAPWNFVSRITTPTLLINGRYDFMHPYEEGQVPFFEAIDVPDADKRFIVLEAGHLPPTNEVIRHTLRWLDERLGPVRR